MNQLNSMFVFCPYVTIEKFSEISGMPVGTIREKISKGQIKIRKKEKKNDRVLINMTSLTQESMQN